jgi:hypothetical protein
MNMVVVDARFFLLRHARVLERRLYEVRFEGGDPSGVAMAVRAYQNPDGGLGHALEPDLRCPESQPLHVAMGLAALAEARYRDRELSTSVCVYLKSVSDDNGLVPFFTELAHLSPLAEHWYHAKVVPAVNPTAEICGFLHYQGVQHDWLSRATETCLKLIMKDPPQDAHSLLATARLAEYIPDKQAAQNLIDVIASTLPKAQLYIPDAPVEEYGLTPLHFAPRPTSLLARIFTQDQIDRHLEDLFNRQQEDGGWPIHWEAPGPAAELEWRGRLTLDAITTLRAWGFIG